MINSRHSSILILFAASLCVAQAPSTSDYSFAISGAQAWTDTGVDLAAGDTLAITAEPKSGSDCSSFVSGKNLQFPSAPAGELIAKTSEKADPILVGSSGDLKATQAGHLFVDVNAGPNLNCTLAVKVKLTHGGTAPAQTGMKGELSSAAQVFFKSQFGNENASSQTTANSAVGGNGATPNTSASSTGGLKLPTVILDADLRKNIDGLPRRVHDHLGNLGDMVNFVIVGSQEKAQAALDAADWHVADVDSKEAGLKAIMNTYEKKDYLQMPMSHLYLFDRMQDFGYEQAQAFSVVATRHHFRIWKAPFTWNNETVWVGAATHDTGFEKDVRTGKLTHKIDPNVDAERENLATGLQKSSKTKSMTYYLPPSPVQEAKNASGGSYHSDGRLLVVLLN
jgi:LssY C-terminus